MNSENVFLCKIVFTMGHHPTPQDFYFDVFESALSEVAFTKITVFLVKCFLEENF